MARADKSVPPGGEDRPKNDIKSRPETFQKRADILRAATEVFAAKGYSAATLAEVAEKCDMTRAGVLHHFGSKRDLLIATLKFRDSRGISLDQAAKLPTGRAMFDHLIETAFLNAQRRGIVQAFVVLSADSITDGSPARAYFEDRYQVLRDEIVENTLALAGAEGLDEQAASLLASSIIAVMDGLQFQWLLDPRAVDLGQATRFAIRALVDSTLPPEAG